MSVSARLGVAALAVLAGIAAAPAAGIGEPPPRRGGDVVLSRPATFEPACLNPFSCPVLPFDPILAQVLEGAFELGPDLVERPNLVSRVDRGRQPFSLTYRIRPEARWSDGTPVTAADFVFTFGVYSTRPPVADTGGYLKKLYARVTRIRAVDAKTVRVELRDSFVDWHDLFRLVLPRHALEGEDLAKVWRDRIDNPTTGHRIGSGPFLIGTWNRGTQLTLVRNGRYWGPHTAYLERIVHRFVANQPDPLDPLRRRELDVAITANGAFIDAEMGAAIGKLPGWRVVSWATPAFEQLTFRVAGAHPALADPRVRRALAYGIDRVEIARAFLGKDARPLDSSVFLPSEPEYRPNWRHYRYDPARSRSLLRQAGCVPAADGVYSCAGKPMRLDFVTTAGNPLRARVLELVRDQLAAVGVEVIPRFVQFGALFDQVLPSGAFDVALFGWLTNGGGGVRPESVCGHAQNWTGRCSRLLTRDARQVDVVLDEDERTKVLQAVDVKQSRSVTALPLVQPVMRAAIRTDLRGFVAGSDQFHFEENSEDWWLARGG